MPEVLPTAEADKQQHALVQDARLIVLFDSQCEVCQAGVSWITALDSEHVVRCLPLSEADPEEFGLSLEDCLRELHIIRADGRVFAGWDAVTELAATFRSTRLLGRLGRLWPFSRLGELAYDYIARNRYALSKCRGGACRSFDPATTRRHSTLTAFWSCYLLGFVAHLPLVARSATATLMRNFNVWRETYGRRTDLLDGKLSICFLNGLLPNAVPLLFGELFATIIYDGVVIDPGSPKMRASLSRFLLGVERPCAIVATHAHEEHVGNLRWVAERTGAPIYVSERTAQFLRPFKQLPFARKLIIGQPPNLDEPFNVLGPELAARTASLQVIATPGHSDDHVALYDPEEKLLLAGDAFMGTYFSTPNPDVDSRRWLKSLERLSELDVEILIEGHGHIHTLRRDIPDIPGVVIREDPRRAIEEKLTYMQWLRARIEEGIREGLPMRVLEASCFPWSRRSSWESCASDECIRVLSLGHFSRSELIRSFTRGGSDLLPTVYEARIYCSEGTD